MTLPDNVKLKLEMYAKREITASQLKQYGSVQAQAQTPTGRRQMNNFIRWHRRINRLKG